MPQLLLSAWLAQPWLSRTATITVTTGATITATTIGTIEITARLPPERQ